MVEGCKQRAQKQSLSIRLHILVNIYGKYSQYLHSTEIGRLKYLSDIIHSGSTLVRSLKAFFEKEVDTLLKNLMKISEHL